MWSLLTMATPLGFSVASFVGIRAMLDWVSQRTGRPRCWRCGRWFPRQERSKGQFRSARRPLSRPDAAGPATALVIANFGWRGRLLQFRGCWACCSARRGGILVPRRAENPSPHHRRRTRRHRGDQDDDTAVDRHGASCAACGRVPVLGDRGAVFLPDPGAEFLPTWLPTYLMNVRHMSLREMGVNASLPWGGAVRHGVRAGWAGGRRPAGDGLVWMARCRPRWSASSSAAAALIAASRAADVVAMMALLCVSLGAIGLVQVSIWSACQTWDAAPPAWSRAGRTAGATRRLRRPGGHGLPGEWTRRLGRRPARRRPGRRGRAPCCGSGPPATAIERAERLSKRRYGRPGLRLLP